MFSYLWAKKIFLNGKSALVLLIKHWLTAWCIKVRSEFKKKKNLEGENVGKDLLYQREEGRQEWEKKFVNCTKSGSRD